MDFKNDFVEIASEILRKEGVTIPTEWNSRDICINFFELTYRWFDSSIPYHVVYSQELLAKVSSLTDDEQNAIKNIEKCLNNCEKITQYMIFVYPRPNYKGSQWEKHRNVTMISAPLMDISSSYIRNSIKEGHSPKYMLTPEVLKYVEDMNFYK